MFFQLFVFCGVKCERDETRERSSVTSAQILTLDIGRIRGAFGDDMGLEATFINRGRAEKEPLAIERFYGVPFAEAPVGSLRWRRPISATNDTIAQQLDREGTFDATKKSTVKECLQPRYYNASLMSEDCLKLNIYRPINAQNLPILIYFHDGYYQNGGIRYHDGAILSHVANAIVVTVQYRLYIFGYLGLGSAGLNFGLYDQQAAVEFIHRNAKNIGGDQSAITIGGLGAGASSVGYLIESETRNFISGAISMLGRRANLQSPKSNLSEKIRKKCAASLLPSMCDTEDELTLLELMVNEKSSQDVLDIAAEFAESFVPRFPDRSFTTQPSNNNSLNYMIITLSPDESSRNIEESLCQVYDVLNEQRLMEPKNIVGEAVGETDLLNRYIAQYYLDLLSEPPATLGNITPVQSRKIIRTVTNDVFYRVPAVATARSFSRNKDNVKMLYLNTQMLYKRNKHVSPALLLFGYLLNPMDGYRGWTAPQSSELAMVNFVVQAVGSFLRHGSRDDPTWPKFGKREFELEVTELPKKNEIEMKKVQINLAFPQIQFWLQDWEQVRQNASNLKEPICNNLETTTSRNSIPSTGRSTIPTRSTDSTDSTSTDQYSTSTDSTTRPEQVNTTTSMTSTKSRTTETTAAITTTAMQAETTSSNAQNIHNLAAFVFILLFSIC